MERQKLAIIGGGSVGAIMVIELSLRLRSKRKSSLDLFLIDPNGFANGGIAYSKSKEAHILNTTRLEMSPWDKYKFHEYLIQEGFSDDEKEFSPRFLYRNFLQKEFITALKQLESCGTKITQINSEAYIRKDGNGFTITDINSDPLHDKLDNLNNDQIVLTVGYGPNNYFENIAKHQNFINSMYPSHKLDTVLERNRPRSIGIIGSAAALYDFANGYRNLQNAVQLYVFSNADNHLKTRDVKNEHKLKDLKLEHIRSLNKSSTIAEVKSAIQNEFRDAKDNDAGPDTWVAFRIMGIIALILKNLSPEIARKFMKSKDFKKIKRLGGPTTPQSLKALSQFDIEFVEKKIMESDIKILNSRQFGISADKDYVVDILINATGHGRHNSPILEDMKIKELAKVDPVLNILEVDESGFRLKGSGIPCIGPATHFGTDGIETFYSPIKKFVELI